MELEIPLQVATQPAVDGSIVHLRLDEISECPPGDHPVEQSGHLDPVLLHEHLVLLVAILESFVMSTGRCGDHLIPEQLYTKLLLQH